MLLWQRSHLFSGHFTPKIEHKNGNFHQFVNQNIILNSQYAEKNCYYIRTTAFYVSYYINIYSIQKFQNNAMPHFMHQDFGILPKYENLLLAPISLGFFLPLQPDLKIQSYYIIKCIY